MQRLIACLGHPFVPHMPNVFPTFSQILVTGETGGPGACDLIEGHLRNFSGTFCIDKGVMSELLRIWQPRGP